MNDVLVCLTPLLPALLPAQVHSVLQSQLSSLPWPLDGPGCVMEPLALEHLARSVAGGSGDLRQVLLG